MQVGIRNGRLLLENDVSLPAMTVSPLTSQIETLIGTERCPFQSLFDGQNHVIYSKGVLFGDVGDCTIKNVKIEGLYFLVKNVVGECKLLNFRCNSLISSSDVDYNSLCNNLNGTLTMENAFVCGFTSYVSSAYSRLLIGGSGPESALNMTNVTLLLEGFKGIASGISFVTMKQVYIEAQFQFLFDSGSTPLTRDSLDSTTDEMTIVCEECQFVSTFSGGAYFFQDDIHDVIDPGSSTDFSSYGKAPKVTISNCLFAENSTIALNNIYGLANDSSNNIKSVCVVTGTQKRIFSVYTIFSEDFDSSLWCYISQYSPFPQLRFAMAVGDFADDFDMQAWANEHKHG